MASAAGCDGLFPLEVDLICVCASDFGDGGQNCLPRAASGTSVASRIPSPLTSHRQQGHCRFSAASVV